MQTGSGRYEYEHKRSINRQHVYTTKTASVRLRQAPKVEYGTSTSTASPMTRTQSVEESQKGTMLSFTEAGEDETKEEIAEMVIDDRFHTKQS